MSSPAPGIAPSLRELVALRQRAPRLRLRPRSAADLGAGAHVSSRPGRGMEFAEVRPYQAGDDIRHVDWRQSARRGRLYSKLFQEERERPVRLLVDLGPHMRFGTRVAFKSVVAARAAAWLAWTAVAAGDRIGGLVCTADGHRQIPPRARERGALALIRLLTEQGLAAEAAPAPDLATPLRALAETTHAGSLVVLISDFRGLSAEAEKQVVRLGLRGQLALVQVYDALEAEAPPPGRYALTDGSRSLTLDLRDAHARAAWGEGFNARKAALQALARRSGALLVPLATDDDLVPRLQHAFQCGAGTAVP